MISNDLIQAAIISKLLTDTALIAWLTARGVADEIREAQYQGTEFNFPCVRVQVGSQQPDGNGPCYTTTGETPFTIYCYSEADSSQQSDQLAGLVDDALLGKHIAGTG